MKTESVRYVDTGPSTLLMMVDGQKLLIEVRTRHRPDAGWMRIYQVHDRQARSNPSQALQTLYYSLVKTAGSFDCSYR